MNAIGSVGQEAIPPSQVLYARLMRSHETSYLTLLSIVQGVAIGFLGASMPSRHATVEWLLFLATFAFLILVWAEYNMGVACLSWIPTFRDVLIPFALGVTEIFMSRLLGQPRYWFFWAAVFCLIGYLAFLNMHTRAKRYPENSEVLSMLGWWKAAGEYFCIASAAIFFALALLNRRELLSAAVPVVIAALFAVRTQCSWRRIVRYAQR